MVWLRPISMFRRPNKKRALTRCGDHREEEVFVSRGIDVEHQDRHVIITLNHPPLNILEKGHIATLCQILGEVREQDDVDLVWIRAGETKAFCAGVSIEDHLRDRAYPMLDAFRNLAEIMMALPQVILTEVFGAALGGGMELVLLSDLVVSADDAKFGQPEILLAQTPPVAAALLPHRVGWQEACRICLLGESMSAAWAKDKGLLTQVVPRAQLPQAAREMATRILKMSGPALRTTKRSLQGPEGNRLAALRYSFQVYLADLLPTHDSQEGLEAFLAKRQPMWTHR